LARKDGQNTTKPAEQLVFHKVAENLYRLYLPGAIMPSSKKAASNFGDRNFDASIRPRKTHALSSA
jgi:hypothetical protein